MAGLSITYDRLQAVDFTNQHIITTITFITSSPKPESNVTLIIKPFEYSVWFYFFISFILMLFNKWLITRYYTQLIKFDISWAIISSTLRQQFSHHLPSVGPLRVLLFGWLLACLVLTSSYSGCLYSLMTVPPKLKTIDSVTELATEQTNGKIQVTATANSTYFESMKVSIVLSVINSNNVLEYYDIKTMY